MALRVSGLSQQRQVVPYLLMLPFAVALAVLVSLFPPGFGLLLGIGIIVVLVALADPEVGLYLLVFSMLLFPQVLVGELAGKGGAKARGITLRSDDFLLLLVGFGWLVRTAIVKDAPLIRRTPINGPIAAYSVSAVVSTALGATFGEVDLLSGMFFVLKYLEYFVVYFIVLNYIRDRTHMRRLVIALLLTAGIASLFGMTQIPSGGRVSALFETGGGEPNTFGGYLVLMFALTGGLFLTASRARDKMLLAALAVVIVIPFLFTLSRASYLAMVAVFGSLFILTKKKMLMGGVLILTALFLYLAPPKAVVDRILFTFTQAPEPGQVQIRGVRLETSFSARLTSLEAVIKDWPKRPILGYGITGYHFVDNQYLRALMEMGLVGFLVFLWIIGTLFRHTRVAYKSSVDPFDRGLSLGFLAGLVGMLIHGAGANTFIIVRIMEPFWFLAAMVIMLPELQREEVQPPQRQLAVASRG